MAASVPRASSGVAFPPRKGLWDLKADEKLWTCLGNSKFHIFTNGETFEKCKSRRGRGARMSRRLSMAEALCENATEGADSAEISGAAGSSSDKAAVLQAGPAYITTTVTWGPIECQLNAE